MNAVDDLRGAWATGHKPAAPGADLRGQRFGRLTVVTPTGHTPAGKRLWLCKCECGGTTVTTTGHLRSGNTASCGCAAREELGRRNLKHGEARRSGKTAEYIVWEGMMRRCYNPRATNFRYYGALGVQVCDRWHDFRAFVADMGRRPDGDISIDRIDPFGDYEPGNTRWANREVQNANKREAHMTAHEADLKAVQDKWGKKAES